MFSRFFIDRPIFAAVISIFIVLAGLAAMRSLPIAQYPEIAPPVVTVQAIYPGASAEVARADRRGADRERDQRRAGHDLHELALDVERRRADPGHVRDRHQRRRARRSTSTTASSRSSRGCRDEVRRQGVIGRARLARRSCRCWRSTRPTAATTTSSSSNYVTLNVLDELKRLPGTTNVQIFGAHDYAMRIWLQARPDGAAASSRPPTSSPRSTSRTRSSRPARSASRRSAGEQDLVYTVTTRGPARPIRRSSSRSSSARIPTARRVRLTDVARVELGSKDYEFIGRFNGKRATLDRHLPVARAPTRSTSPKTVRADDGGARDAVSRRASPTRCRSTRRASSRCRSTR